MGSGLILKLYRVSEWITRIAGTNLLWVLFNIPIAYLTVNIFLVKTADQLLVNILSIAILAPFIFFPSTTALFGVVRKWVIGETDVKVFRSFWKFYKENYVRSMLGGLVIVPIWIILAVDYFYFTNANTPLFYLFLLIGMFLFVFSIHFFSNSVHFHLKFGATLKNSMILAIGRPAHTIGITIVTALILYISFNIFTFLILLGMGSLIAFGSFFIYYRCFKNNTA
jgi:uncharacterized membrane protein YesL